jgi:WD40 repeat protein
LSPDGNNVAVNDINGTVKIQSLIKGKRDVMINNAESYNGERWFFEFISNGKYLLTTGPAATVKIWEASTGRYVRTIIKGTEKSPISILGLSPHKKYMAVGIDEHTVLVLNVLTGREVMRLSQDSSVRDIAFSHDEKFIATSSKGLDDSIRIWNLSTGEESSRKTYQSEILGFAFSPDDSSIAVMDIDQNLELWRWRPDELITEVCNRLRTDSRVFEGGEWRHSYWREKCQSLDPVNKPMNQYPR